MRKTLLLLFGLLVVANALLAQFVIDSVKAPCYVGCYGQAYLSPDIAGYNYRWNNASTGVHGTGLCPGPVFCVVRDAGNVIIDTVYATIPNGVPLYNPVITSNNTNCNGPYNGDIVVHAIGGVPPYTYVWNGSYTSTDSVRPMLAGNFWVEVFDAVGCVSSWVVNVPQFSQMQTSTPWNNPASHCTTNDAGLQVLADGGAEPYTYLWADGTTGETNTNLHTGIHTVTVTDLLGCTTTHTDSVGYGPIFPNQWIGVGGACNGSIYGSISAYGLYNNYPPFTYMWSTGDTTMYVPWAQPGEYSVTVTDNMGCSQIFTDTIFTGTFLVDTTFVNATTCQASDGMATATAIGVPPINYSWRDLSTNIALGFNDSANNLPPGNYSLQVWDDIGCSMYTQFTITGDDLQVAHSETPVTGCQNIPGSSTITLPGNAGNGYEINWGDGSTVQYTNAQVATHNYNNAGSYNVYVNNSQGFCYDTVYVTIANQGMLIDTNVIEYPGCVHPGGGQISISANGANAPYTYNWSNGNTTTTITQLPAGTYIVTVTDTTGCQAERIFILPEVNSFGYYALALANATDCNGNDGVASIQPYGGNPPYTYVWNTNPLQINDTATGLSAGIYHVTVTDSLGCITTGHINIGDGCIPQITGVLYIDSNNNCVFDSTEMPLNQVLVAAAHNGQFYYGTTNNSGYYSISVPDTGSYQVNANYQTNTMCLSSGCSDSAHLVTINGMDTTAAGIDFAYSFTAVNQGSNLVIHPGWTLSIPGSAKDFWIIAFNSAGGINTLYSYTFTFDSSLTFISSDIPYTSYNPATRTLVWINTPLTNIGRIHFVVNANTPLNYLMENYFAVTQLADECNTLDNILHTSEPVTGSRDPNSKEVQPAGPLTDADSVLIYTIHFQNNGNDTTWFITLLDTLQPELDPASVVNLASSHPYTEFTITGTGILRWFFNPIYLPDSTTNPLGSQGFVMFSIKRKAGLQPGHAINNTAHIYFDYNEAVVTNTITSTVATPVGIKTVASPSNVSAQAYPNPFTSETFIAVKGAEKGSNLAVSDITGKRLMEIAIPDNGLINVKRDKLASGLYFYAVLTNGRQMATGRLIAE